MELRVGTTVSGPGGRRYRVAQIKKFNPNHDERGRFAEAPGGSIVAFHGTVGANVDRIKREGFHSLRGAAGGMYRDYRDRSVHVASHEGDARAYADMRLSDHTSGKAVVFELRIPWDKWRAFKEDPLHFNPGRAAYTQKTIPPEWIVGTKVWAHRDVGGRLVKWQSADEEYVTAFAVIIIDDEEVEKGFDPSQPRDAEGQWTSVGGRSRVVLPTGKPLSAAAVEEFTVYHGTSSEAWESIKAEGLVPSGSEGSDEWATQQGTEIGAFLSEAVVRERKASVFISPDRGEAETFAKYAASVRNCDSVIVEVRIPRKNWERISVDEEFSMAGLRHIGSIPSEWIAKAEILLGVGWVPLKKADDFVRAYFVLLTARIEKAFNPSQPRDERGRWSSSGGGTNIPAFLAMVGSMQGNRGTDAFILEHGQDYSVDGDSYVGGTPHECFKNSTLKAMADDDLTYVEGYVSVHGVPIKHAWNINKAGVVRDYTIGDSRGIRGYFGVPIRTDYMMRAVLAAKVYGVLTHNQTQRLSVTDPAEIVARRIVRKAFDPSQPRDREGQWTSGLTGTVSWPGSMSEYDQDSGRVAYLVEQIESQLAAGTEPKVVTLANPRDLLATQSWLSDEGGGGDPVFPDLEEKYGKMPVLARTTNDYRVHVLDGHHRAFYAAQKGGRLRALMFTVKTLPVGKSFDPSQPRDREGQWTSGGGGGLSEVTVPTEQAMSSWKQQMDSFESVRDFDEEAVGFMQASMYMYQGTPLSQRRAARFVGVVDEEGSLVAAGFGRIHPGGEMAEIINLGSVRPGAGAKALGALEFELSRSPAARNLREFRLTASDDNMSFYLRNGYREVLRDEIEIVMSKRWSVKKSVPRRRVVRPAVLAEAAAR